MNASWTPNTFGTGLHEVLKLQLRRRPALLSIIDCATAGWREYTSTGEVRLPFEKLYFAATIRFSINCYWDMVGGTFLLNLLNQSDDG